MRITSSQVNVLGQPNDQYGGPRVSVRRRVEPGGTPDCKLDAMAGCTAWLNEFAALKRFAGGGAFMVGLGLERDGVA